MPLRLFNTLTNRTEDFTPITPGQATFYSCGPTVYDYAHIGNFRSFLAADVLRRWLESPLGPNLKVTQVMNITDVGHMVDDSAADGGGEDKMEEARKRLLQDKKAGKLPPEVAASIDPSSPTAIADYYARSFIDDARTLGLRVVHDAEKDPTLMPRPTRMVPQMLAMILELLRRGHAYVVPTATSTVVYFDTQTFPDYGKLSGNTLDKVRSGAGGRVSDAAQSTKRHPADFMLWKGDPTHLMRWDPLKELKGKDLDDARRFNLQEGYPGWHIECSAMAKARLGETIDLHSGGEDNIFPHHECEIAQSRCANGTPGPGGEPQHFARYWFHPRFLQVEGAKMSKSKGNFYTVRDLVGKGFSPAAIRLELIKTHYRSNANFTEQGLKDAERMVTRWRDFTARGEANPSAEAVTPEEPRRAFADAMNDDLNIAGALGALNAWLGRTPTPTRTDAALMRHVDEVLGVLTLGTATPRGASGGGLGNVEGSEGAPSDDPQSAMIDDLVRRRTEARKAKDWPESDRIRDELARLNVVVTDTPQGPKWSRKAAL
ncbi:MAG: cysteine--tRNA ligase [Phycisphaerales bacterium]